MFACNMQFMAKRLISRGIFAVEINPADISRDFQCHVIVMIVWPPIAYQIILIIVSKNL